MFVLTKREVAWQQGTAFSYNSFIFAIIIRFNPPPLYPINSTSLSVVYPSSSHSTALAPFLKEALWRMNASLSPSVCAYKRVYLNGKTFSKEEKFYQDIKSFLSGLTVAHYSRIFRFLPLKQKGRKVAVQCNNVPFCNKYYAKWDGVWVGIKKSSKQKAAARH